jgi:CheY-like chemotaxis protein
MVSKKILVVDDDEAIREVMKLGLVKLGYDPAFAENGKEALEILTKENFPVILMDIRMPGIDGIELCIQTKKRSPETVIYAFSGIVTEGEFYELEEKGFDGLLCKPVPFKVLKQAIEGAFDKINNRGTLSTPPCNN